MENNCTGTVDHFEDRMCFNVTELQCELQEVVTYDMVDETYNVQKCTQVSDRVCDTVYDLAVSVLTLCWGMVGNIVLYNFSFEGLKLFIERGKSL